MMQRSVLLSAVLSVCAASSVAAQPIYHHTQKAAYLPGDVLPFLEPQFHFKQYWRDGLDAHTHTLCVFNMYLITTAEPFKLQCTSTLYQTDGQITHLLCQSCRDYRFDDPSITVDDWGNLSQPLVGDPTPDAVKKWNFTVTVDPLKRGPWLSGTEFPPLHGKYTIYLGEITQYANGSRVGGAWFSTFYSLIDPTAEEYNNLGIAPDCMPVGGFAFPVYDPPTAAIRIGGPHEGDPNWSGLNAVDICAPLPIAPIAAPWKLFRTKGYNYVSDELLPEGRYEIVLNPDFHHHNHGTSLRFETTPNFEFDDVIDPAILPQKDNRVLIGWERNTGTTDVPFHFPGNQEVVTWVAFGVTKGDGVITVPPPVVEPPPVVTPPPVPTVFTPLFKHLGAALFICEDAAHCVELVTR